jgi:hypothetical protein
MFRSHTSYALVWKKNNFRIIVEKKQKGRQAGAQAIQTDARTGPRSVPTSLQT